LLVGSTDGALYLIDGQGALIERKPVSSAGIQSTPAVADGVLYVGTGEGVAALRLQA
jgi:outer membrane protein assembly factor BamB